MPTYEFVFCFQALVPKLKDQDPNPGVVTSVLAAIGELAQVSFLQYVMIENNFQSRSNLMTNKYFILHKVKEFN